jgi:hypothetical protein
MVGFEDRTAVSQRQLIASASLHFADENPSFLADSLTRRRININFVLPRCPWNK